MFMATSNSIQKLLAPYLNELSSLELGDKFTVHFDGGFSENLFDFEPYLDSFDEAQIYCCGPKPLMDHVKKLTSQFPKERVNFEDFVGISKTSNDSQSFLVEQFSTGDQFEIPHNKSIIEVLDKYGFEIETVCESGTCGTCLTQVIKGRVDHRDSFLEEPEKSNHILPCVSRAAHGELLILDF